MGRISELGTTLVVLQLLVTDYVVPSALILSTVMIEAIVPYEMSVLTRATRRQMPEGGIIHSHRHEILISYKWIFALFADEHNIVQREMIFKHRIKKILLNTSMFID
jgi:hypothetical protein